VYTSGGFNERSTSDPFPGIPGFELQEAQILDDVLTMGCPTVPGFDQMFITETAQIAAELKSTVGHVVAQERAYLGNLPYLLISARVKGGNSGGLVIGREGKVVGVVAQLPAEAEGRLDMLGYGVVVPTSILKQLLQATHSNSDPAERLSFKQKDGIITTTSTIAPTN
jgi:serine protease Do